MAKVLFIKSTPVEDEYSRSTQIARVFVKRYLELNPEDEIIELDLFNMDVPFIDLDILNAKTKLRTQAELTEAEAKKLEQMDRYTEQFVQADKYIVVSPLWNLGVPPVLKAYFDSVCWAGKTFRYTAHGAVGLLENKLGIHIHGCGGVYSNGGAIGQYADPYVTGVMKFMGVTMLPTLFVEGIDEAPSEAETILAKARELAIDLAERFVF
ncbi:FMN-dependent NADH-azoreductase [Paenibacillus sp. HN-1]|uniref:FMN-dependent NADH-azoreductase n=1 Tax=Paenibacillus TaxID=44249 RepID=UPI001CA9F301|nr:MULTISPECIES: FMN-dependent NADH-azoreductase [Paenibacillus]MBY9079360.1 FMN-dependent NADH-azoreductase [Paenibacillus sp. CGMCC 1.18879]MBY9087285.1 FMN-dependent NADH-azoreductase [Paenibacillus sinensis]